MKFIINTYDLVASKSMIETLLENGLDNPISVKEVKEITDEELDELAIIKYPCNCSLDENYCDCCINPDLKKAYKDGCKEMLKRFL